MLEAPVEEEHSPMDLLISSSRSLQISLPFHSLAIHLTETHYTNHCLTGLFHRDFMQWVWVFVPHKHSLLCTFPVLESWKMLFNLNVLSLLVFIDSHFIFRFPIIGISVLWIVSMVQPLTTNEVKRYTSSLCTVCMVSIASFCFVDILTCS